MAEPFRLPGRAGRGGVQAGVGLSAPGLCRLHRPGEGQHRGEPGGALGPWPAAGERGGKRPPHPGGPGDAGGPGGLRF